MENKTPHPLKAWLHTEGRKIGWFADQIGVDRATISQWFSGARTPLPITRRAIEAFTNGAVAAASWEKKE